MDDVLLYHYYFNGFDKPLTIQAINKEQARQALNRFLNTMPELEPYTRVPIDGETVSHPIAGISTRQINGITYLWAGLAEAPENEGWKIQEKLPNDKKKRR